MKNKDVIVGFLVVMITCALMTFSLYYTKNNLSKENSPANINVIINKKDPRYKPLNWGMNRTKTKQEAMIERMTYN